jgi:hypothetical protein
VELSLSSFSLPYAYLPQNPKIRPTLATRIMAWNCRGLV